MFVSESAFREAGDFPAGPSADRPRPASPAAAIGSAVILAGRPEWTWELGGLTVLERMVRTLERRGVPRIRVVRAGEAGEDALPEAIPRAAAASEGATLVVTTPALADPAGIAALEGVPVPRGRPVRLIGASAEAGIVLGYLVAAGDAGFATEVFREPTGPVRAEEVLVPPRPGPGETGLFLPISGRDGIASAKAALRRSLKKPTDGFFAAWIDRGISTRFSLLLARTPITPNQVTLLALAPALAGAALLAAPSAAWSAAGALLFWISTVLDGCDGEVARLKYQESAGGARLDLFCDNVALVAVFLGILVHVHREGGGGNVPLLGAAILAGMIGCMVTEYVRILRPRISGKGADLAAARDSRATRVLWYERLASRDFAYLLPFLAWFGWLRYLIWATAFGVNVFWLVLATFVATRRREVSR